MLPRLGLWMLSVVLLGANATAQDKLQQTLLAEETKLIEAIKQKDKATLNDMLAEEVTSITASRGRQSTAEIVRDLENITFTSYRLSDVKTIAVSPHVAILTYRFTWTGGRTGQTPATSTAYATSIWKRRDGKWRSVFYQETPVTEREVTVHTPGKIFREN